MKTIGHSLIVLNFASVFVNYVGQNWSNLMMYFRANRITISNFQFRKSGFQFTKNVKIHMVKIAFRKGNPVFTTPLFNQLK